MIQDTTMEQTIPIMHYISEKNAEAIQQTPREEMLQESFEDFLRTHGIYADIFKGDD